MAAKKWMKGKRLLTLLLTVMLTSIGIVSGSTPAFAGTGMATNEQTATDSNSMEERPATAGNALPAAASGERVLSATDGNALLLATGSDAGRKEFRCETAEGIAVSVFLTKENEFPEGTKLRVEPVGEDEEHRAQLIQCVKEKWAVDASDLKAYKIGFYDENGEELEVRGTALVVIQFTDEPLNAKDGLAVIHFKNGQTEELRIGSVEMDADKMVTGLSFQTDSFSDFGFLEHYTVPITGGAGTDWYTIAGVLMLLGAALLYRKPDPIHR